MEPTRRRTRDNRANGAGFTLVELLVVITIIGILVGLIGVAAARALKTARQSQIKTELDQISMAFDTYRDTYGSYPSNCQVDGVSATEPLDESQVLVDLRRHFNQAFPRNREPVDLIAKLAGLVPPTAPSLPPTLLGPGQPLQGGMSAGEAIVFWLGGFSADPKYPISGEGGPSYVVVDPANGINIPPAKRREADPLDRKWIFPFKVARLEPRANDKFFDEKDNRFIEYLVTINGQSQTRRINFWQYVPDKSDKPYVYFDTSRHQPEARFDPPAATPLAGPIATPIYAIKRAAESSTATLPIQFCNQDKFQVLHAGVDEEWGDFTRMSAALVVPPTDPTQYLLFPNGPFTGEVADTIVNFSQSTLEHSQP